MTSGIYKIEFPNGQFYIGKSEDIERRWKEHLAKFESGKAARPMQAAYDKWAGVYNTNIVLECHSDHIDVMEAAFINHGKEKYPHLILNTSIPKDPGIRTYDEDLLQMSMEEQMQEIKDLRNDVEEMEERIQRIKAGTIVEDLETEISILNNTTRSLEERNKELIQELYRLNNRGFWARLFNF